MILTNALQHQTTLAGNVLRIRYYTESALGSVWDDDRTISKSGADLYISGVISRMDSSDGSEDQVLLEQGRIRYNDSKIYVNGSIQTTSGIRVFTIAISGTDRVYEEVLPGVYSPQYLGTDIYKKVYLREVPLGSVL